MITLAVFGALLIIGAGLFGHGETRGSCGLQGVGCGLVVCGLAGGAFWFLGML